MSPLRDLGGVRDDDDRRPVAMETLELVEHPSRVGGVEVPGRFVGEDQLRLGGDGSRDGDALPLPSRQGRCALVQAVVETDRRCRTERLLAPFRARGAPVQQIQFDAVDGRPSLEEVECLEHEADRAGAHARRLRSAVGVHRLPVEVVGPRRGGVEKAQDVQEGRLSASRGTDDGDELAPGDVEVYAAQGSDIRPPRGGERPLHASHPYHWLISRRRHGRLLPEHGLPSASQRLRRARCPER